jgi:hypothetical protein
MAVNAVVQIQIPIRTFAKAFSVFIAQVFVEDGRIGRDTGLCGLGFVSVLMSG